uniref:helicase-related protein n=1 Tax=Limnohabitans sp. DM1 TaxID=1597955 RepID=UPI000ABD7135
DINAFKSQFTGSGGDLAGLRQRLDSFCKRTLRKDVTEYIKYTERKAITQKFRSTDDEHRFYEAVSDYLTREDSYAIPRRQRHLTELVLRKLLASSSLAIAGTLGVMKERLEKLRDQKIQNTTDWDQNDWIETLVSQEEMEEDLLDEILNGSDETPETGTTAAPTDPAQLDRQRLNAEISELDRLHAWAQGIGTDTKTTALLQALDVGFNALAQMQTGGAAQRKALIFTESRRTQEYLKRFLEHNGHAGKVVLFSGTNSGPEASNIYERWLTANQGTGRISGSRDIDIRTALIEHFRDEADILIATEAAAEGVNMQFCSLVINYDLPWNPQRVEQRIGRCHRYGQKHDVVVINFFNERNHADARVLELLAVKFKLFDGVFGASDEVLGSIESGVDIERRILDIYRTCRTPAQIDAAFAALGQAMKPAIDERMAQTRSQLLEVFDAEVHERLRLQRQDTLSHLNQFSRRFWDLTRHVLAGQAWFDEEHLSFDLPAPTAAGMDEGIPPGRYHLISRQQPSDANSLAVNEPGKDAHTYRLSHPLGEWVVHAACQASTPVQRLVFDTRQTEARVSVVEALRGQSGVLTLQKLTVDSFEKQEYLLFSALTNSGQSLDQETCEKLMATPATLQSNSDVTQAEPATTTRLQQEAKRHADATVAHALETNNAHFTEARDKLDRSAEDMVQGAEQALRNTREQIRIAQREARHATSLDEQHAIQERIAKLERQLRRQRQEIFEVEDDVKDKREQLIEQLTQRMTQRVQTETLMTLTWVVI